MNHYFNPVKICQGKGCLAKLPDLLQSLVADKGSYVLLIVWSECVLEHEIIKDLLNKQDGYKVHPVVFTASNPSVQDLYGVYDHTRKLNLGAVVGIGGGSVLDVAKSLCCLHDLDISNIDELRTAIIDKRFTENKMPWIGIPTTAGTGSEVTCWATIWDPEIEVKRSVESKENYAYAALIDPDLSSTLPLALAVSSALDAVAHAVESYWAKASNCVSKALALSAIREIMLHIDGLFSEDFAAHDAMSKGSMLAGLAFSNTKTTACHSISYPLTMHYHIPHGVAVSMLLAPVFTLNLPQIEDPKSLLAALGVKDADEFKARINGLLTRASIKSTLSQWGADKSDIEALVPLCITKGRADNNPVLLTNENIASILESIY